MGQKILLATALSLLAITGCSTRTVDGSAINVSSATLSHGELAINGSGVGVVNSFSLTQDATTFPFSILSATDGVLLASLTSNATINLRDVASLTMSSAVAQSTGTLTVDLSGAKATTFSSTGITDNATGTLITLTAAGNVGIGTGSPLATLSIAGHQEFHGNAPAVSACGTSPSISGNDSVGRVAVGTTPSTTCTLTFVGAWTNAPVCFAQDETSAVTMRVSTVSATSVTFTASGTLTAADAISYHCVGFE